MKIKIGKKRDFNRSYYPPWSRSWIGRILNINKPYQPVYKKNQISLKTHLPYILVTTSIIVSYFQSNDLIIFLSYIILIPIFAILKFDGRIPIAYAILMLIIAAILLAYGNEDLANQAAIYAYWLLVVGVICLTIEYLREQREEKRSSGSS